MTTLKIKKSTTNKIHKIAAKWLAAERAYELAFCKKYGFAGDVELGNVRIEPTADDRGAVVHHMGVVGFSQDAHDEASAALGTMPETCLAHVRLEAMFLRENIKICIDAYDCRHQFTVWEY
tara:strand:+ start:219 stop:581 length:363 start_codon:yes stop_codon:yes gene_type:complete